MKDCTGPQGGWGGWPTGKGKKLSSSQAQLGQATCLAVASFLSISCGHEHCMLEEFDFEIVFFHKNVFIS